MNFDQLLQEASLDSVVVDRKDYQRLLDLLERVYDLGIEEGRFREFWSSTGGDNY